MSLASEYAARQSTAKQTTVTAEQSAPPPFHCATCDATVTLDGACSLTPGTGTGAVDLSALDAVKLRDWLTETFT